MTEGHLRKDFMGRKLCEHCWNGMHEIYRTDIESRKTRKVSNCLGYGCECPCTKSKAKVRKAK